AGVDPDHRAEVRGRLLRLYGSRGDRDARSQTVLESALEPQLEKPAPDGDAPFRLRDHRARARHAYEFRVDRRAVDLARDLIDEAADLLGRPANVHADLFAGCGIERL